MSTVKNNPELTQMTAFNGSEQDNWRLNSTTVYTILAFIVLLGAFIRMVKVVNLDFPLNDGGQFYQMILDLRASNYSLPEFTGYNLTSIPFAYPPLAFYVGAFLSNTFHWSVLDIVRLMPATISILTIPAFYLLSKKLLPNNSQALLATFTFSFLPTSFDWLIVGGGLTRSFGYLFAILTLRQVYELCTSYRTRHIFFSIVFASLTVLSHPGVTWFALYSTAIILFFNLNRLKKWLLRAIMVGLGVLLLTAPWWLTIINHHGWGVFLSPFQTETRSFTSYLIPFTFLFTNEPLLDIMAMCGLLGVLICIKNRSYFLPVWLFLVFIFETRLGVTYSVVPMSMLVSIGIDQGIRLILIPTGIKNPGKLQRWMPKTALVYFVLYTIISAYLGVNYQTVSQEQVSTMQWIEINTPQSSKFLVLSGVPEYGIDQVTEWFPALSQRTSLTTPQGHEWLPDKEFSRRVELHAELQKTFLACSCQEIPCIDDWAAERDIHFSYIYLPESVPYKFSVVTNPNFEILYDSPGGMVLSRK